MANMTVADCKKSIFRLLNQYSIAGTETPLTYNDQEDDMNRMLDLINDAQLEIAITSKPILEKYTVTVPEVDYDTPVEEIETEMPEDFICASAIHFLPLYACQRVTREPSFYKWIGEKTLLLPNRPAGEYTIVYHKYPERLALDTDTLENTPDAQAAIPYFCAAMIALDDNPKAYYALYNVWETRLSRLGVKPAHATMTIVDDVYGLNQFGGIW